MPPSTPKIYDIKRRDISNVPTAYADEGANLTLVCEVHGGKIIICTGGIRSVERRVPNKSVEKDALVRRAAE